MAREPKSAQPDIARLVEQADIGVVAERLGLHVDNRSKRPRRAICPFHNDKDPSLNLYSGGSGQTARDHYHCFVCGAHGDAISLIQNYEKISFWEAVQRLATIEGFELGTSRRPAVDRATGAALLSKRLESRLTSDERFMAFCNARGFDPTFLRSKGAASTSLDDLIKSARADRTVEEQLVEAGVLRRDDGIKPVADLYGPKLRGFFGGTRVVLPIDGPRGETVGFAARALDDQAPKYLYSYNFPRRTSLYREGRVLNAIQEQGRNSRGAPVNVYLVEGIFDTLRLEQLGFLALGVLGAQLTPGQVERIARIQELVADFDGELRFHIFFDGDDAGKRGAYDATLQLLRLLQHGQPFDLKIIAPHKEAAAKIDPDDFLRNATAETAQDKLHSASVGPLEFLAAYRLKVEPFELEWSSVSRLRLASIARSIAYALRGVDWSHIIAPLPTDENEGLAQFAALVTSYGGRPSVQSQGSQVLQQLRDPADNRSDLLTALTLGRSSTSRREYPLDDDAWERLAIAASPLFHIHKARLAAADGPSSPLLARQLPKGGGKYRLKSGPVAHDAILQQYALIELLRDRDDCPVFADSIPAIRYSRDVDSEIYKTGSGQKQPALSFAYQIDMAIVNGLTPPRREGIFRPYFECWRSFVDFIDGRIKQFRHEEMQILRLDITGFYDHIRSDIFGEALAQPLERALHSLNFADGDIGSFAPLLAPHERDEAAGRAEAFTRFLLRHSFGLRYFNPISGEETPQDSKRGVPQGPDLSAYLANIALFDLDDMMGAEVARLNEAEEVEGKARDPDRCSAAYARYVDDIVIICSDFETAAQFRRKIESFIALKGLSLNRKNVTPPPMTRSQARGWITDNRAGFGFSGPLADLPTTEAMDPLADAGEIDRRTALGLLFDPELDNPANADAGVKKISLALSADDVRFSDRANAYRRLWCFAADLPSDGSGDSLAKTFVDLLARTESRALLLASDEDRLDIALAAMEGLDRALRSAVPPGIFGDALCERIARNLRVLSNAVLDDLFTSLEAQLLGSNNGRLLSRFDTRCQIGIIACLAVEKLRPQQRGFQFTKLHKFLSSVTDGLRALPSGLLQSLLKHDASFEQGLPPLVVARGQSVDAALSRLNQTLVQLQRAAAHGMDEGPGPLSVPALIDPNEVVTAALSILRIWVPGSAVGDGDTPSEVELDAAATLVNVTYSVFGEIAAQRPRLTQIIANAPGAMPLPSPPGLRTSGILLWCPNGRLLLATADIEETTPLGVTWTELDQNPVPGIALREAMLPTSSKLLVNENRKWSPAEIARLYRAGYPLFKHQLDSDTDRVPVPTAFSFFATVTDEEIDFASVQLVSWPALRSSVDGHAFVRMGHSLEARSVHADGADLWRYGWAVRDACDRAEPSHDDDAGMDVQAAAPLDQDFHRREAIIARVLPRLSGADRWGPGEGSPDNPIPTRIRRALKLLESFEQANTAAEAASCLVAAVSEGMFMSERLSSLDDLTSGGNAAELLAKATRRVSRALPEAAKHWDVAVPPSLPHRRSASAWQRLSAAIGQAGAQLPEDATDPLNALEVGAEALAAISDLRSLAFEIAAGLPEDTFGSLAEAEFDLDWVSDTVGLDLIMINGWAARDPSLAVQSSRLVRAFCQLVLGQRGGLNIVRDQITPAGWVVLVAILVQIVPVRQRATSARPALWQMNAGAPLAVSALKKLLEYFASSSEASANAPNWPWDVFEQLLLRRPADLASLLRQITDATGINVTDEISTSNPRTGDNQGDRPIVRLADGSSISLAEWQIDVSYARGERGAGMEAYPDGNRLRFPYSISRLGDQVLGLHLVSRKLGEAAFGRLLQNDPIQLVTTETAHGDAIADPAFASASGGVAAAVPANERFAEAKSSTAPIDPVMGDDALVLFERRQARSWEDRSEKNFGSHRVALVQWDVTDSYFSPGRKGGAHEGLVANEGDKVADPAAVKKGGVFLSTSEHRRRAVIREVLKACAAFKVDGLIFPEYSLRPETINWLARQLKTLPREIIVWCGTFRVPNATQLDFDFSGTASAPYLSSLAGPLRAGISRWNAHTAVLTCLQTKAVKGSTVRVESFARQKRYPSAAAGELIRPPFDQPWSPLLVNERRHFKLGTFALELVCSEMFPHASSANFVGIIEESNELADRYGLGKGGETMFDHVSNDIYEFARWTAFRNPARVLGDTNKALIRGEALQRTLIVLPAMTTRSADYHIFGQNQYLAAGLVTAFCNAVLPHASCGQSGFIGLDGWKRTEGIKTPYGTKGPGIFQLGDTHSGPLGETESAMVIADLDLMRTTDQRPRPHYQHRSLRLVAHLPFFFATEKGSHSGPGAYPNKQRQIRTRTVDGDSLTFADARAKLVNALNLEPVWRSQLNVASRDEEPPPEYEEAIAETLAALRVLEEFADDPAWLRKRTESFQSERYEMPPISPLPALVDWLYVDDRWIPGSKGTEAPAGGDDPLKSDKSILGVPRSMQDEPQRLIV